MPESKRERMSSVDTAWLRMDRPSNLMMICGVLLLRDRIALSRLRSLLAERFLRFARFRQRVVQAPVGAYWEADADFDIAAHVKAVALGGRGGKVQLQALVSKLMSAPLDPHRPLWQFHLVQRFNGGSAVIMRIHHCYADGIALIQVMLSMTDADRKGRVSGSMPPPSNKREPDAVTSAEPLDRGRRSEERQVRLHGPYLATTLPRRSQPAAGLPSALGRPKIPGFASLPHDRFAWTVE